MGERESGMIYFGSAALLLAAGGASLFFYSQAGAEVSETKAADQVVVSLPSESDVVTLTAGKNSLEATWKQLGVSDQGFDRSVAATFLADAGQLNTASRNARLDVEKQTIVKAQTGSIFDQDAAVALIESAMYRGEKSVDLPVTEVVPEVDDVGIEDVSHVLGHFTTKFKAGDSSRSYNLKLAASKLNGYVMKPGEEISFNEVVGGRTHDEGYKIAGVIQSGQLVDGLAGGTCQISTTLYGAAFFAGLGITQHTPHSRPSSYVRGGLDATVVYPVGKSKGVDLKIQNDYDFPVAIHFIVARGKSTVRILGKKRPYDEIVFERKVTKELPFRVITREDDTMPVGSMTVDQPGYPGYRLYTYRKFYKDGKMVNQEKTPVHYRPVVEYVRVGINPNPNLRVPKGKKKKNLSVISGDGRMAQ